jgi:hypothetical protein
MTMPFVVGSGHTDFFTAFGVGAPTDTGLSTSALSAGYVYGTSGRAMCFFFKAPETGDLTEIGVVPDTFTGTWGSTDGVIDFEIREGLNGNRIPGITLIGSGTITLTTGDAGQWVIKTGLSIPLVAGRNYCLILFDADGGGTNFVTMQASRGSWSNASFIAAEWGSTGNGFATAYTQSGSLAVVYLRVGGRSVVGAAMQNLGTFSGGTNRRGNRFRLPFDAWVVGCVNRTDAITGAGARLELYADATAPGGTKLIDFELPTQAGSGTIPTLALAVMFPQSVCYRVLKDNWYRFVLNPPGSQTTPRRGQWIAGANANLIAGRQPWENQWTIESGGTWSDDADWMCTLRPLLIPDEPSASSNPQRVLTF